MAMGPLLARCGKVVMPLPGGCTIGKRPIDLHLKGFRALGVKVTEDIDNSCIILEAPADGLVGDAIYLDFPSVGATENILMAAALAKGPTILENAAKEPEIVDLANMLNKMVSVPAPLILAPILLSMFARSTISGSLAAFSRIVGPLQPS